MEFSADIGLHQGMVYTPMMYGGGMTEEVRENRKKRSLLGVEGSGKSPAPVSFFPVLTKAGWDVGK